MDRNFTISFLLAMFLYTCIGTVAVAQGQEKERPAASGESIQLFTDREIYGISEKIFYTASYQKPSQIGQLDWSTVLYVELIKWDGSKLVQSKVSIENGSAHGYIQLPSTVSSGNYFLRAYTKWMRNYSPYTFTYLPVKIINPYSIAVDKGPKVGDEVEIAKLEGNAELTNGIEISALSASYGKRQVVDFEITMLDDNLSGQYCISVAKMEDGDAISSSYSYDFIADNDSSKQVGFLPEINGLTLSGKIINTSTSEPVQGMKVNLSSYSNSFFFSAVSSDSDGSFLFTLPHYEGVHEFHIAKEIGSDDEIKVLVESEYCHQAVTLPYIVFQLNEKEKAVAGEIILNAQLNAKYSSADFSGLADQNVATAFYGEPISTILEKEFIELLDLKEFFYELVYSVSVAYKQKKPYLVVNGQTSLVSYPPLILLDNIPVANDENLLAIPCRRIDRIEVINKGYVVGDFKYSGLISIYSEDKNMAGLKMGKNRYFFNYLLFDNNEFSNIDYSSPDDCSTIPDRRNLLHWEPNLYLSADQPGKISFYTSDASGQYVVSIRSTDKESGSEVYKQAVFTVE